MVQQLLQPQIICFPVQSYYNTKLCNQVGLKQHSAYASPGVSSFRCHNSVRVCQQNENDMQQEEQPYVSSWSRETQLPNQQSSQQSHFSCHFVRVLALSTKKNISVSLFVSSSLHHFVIL